MRSVSKDQSYRIITLEGCPDEIPYDAGFMDGCREKFSISSIAQDQKEAGIWPSASSHFIIRILFW